MTITDESKILNSIYLKTNTGVLESKILYSYIALYQIIVFQLLKYEFIAVLTIKILY